MSEVALFAFGSVVFIISSWATLAFGLSRFHELQLDDMEESRRIAGVREEGLTEIYVTRRLDSETDLTSGEQNGDPDPGRDS